MSTDWEVSLTKLTEKLSAYEHLPNHISRCQPDDQPDKHPGEYRHECLMDHTDAFYLEVIRSPERKDEEKTDEEEGPGRVVFLVLSHWFVRWSRSGPDVNVRRGELRSVHSSGVLSMAASVRRLRKASMMGRRKQADRVSACRLLFRHPRRSWSMAPISVPPQLLDLCEEQDLEAIRFLSNREETSE